MSAGRRPGLWNPAKATEKIRALAIHEDIELDYQEHAKQRLEERDILTSDVLFLCANGYVFEEGEKTTRRGFYKYKMRGITPNSRRRELCVVVIPCENPPLLKIITVMYADRPIIGG